MDSHVAGSNTTNITTREANNLVVSQQNLNPKQICSIPPPVERVFDSIEGFEGKAAKKEEMDTTLTIAIVWITEGLTYHSPTL